MTGARFSACITGMGWLTALGDDLNAVWDALLKGESGLTDVPSAHRLRNTRAAVVPSVDREGRPAERQRIMAGRALARALRDACLDSGDSAIYPVLGTSYGPHLDEPATHSLSLWAAEAARDAGLVNSPLTVSTACSAGSDSLLIGLELLRSGTAEVCVCGGADVLTAAKRLGHSLLGTMSATDIRPFDVGHDGTLLGEGAGFMVIETGESAAHRGVRVHGLLAGTGSSNDATGSAAPDPSGHALGLAVRRALDDAGVPASGIAMISAHGSATPSNDMIEARGYSKLFGECRPDVVVFATKGAFGHTLGATGLLEAITVVQALKHGCVPPIHGLADAMPDVKFKLAGETPTPVAGRFGLSVTLGFGGFNTCLLLASADADPG